MYREKTHPNSASCRFLFRLVNYSVRCHLGWPFWGQNNLGFSCLWLCSVHCPYQSCYKRRPRAIHTHLQLHCRHFTLLTVYLLPERFLCFFSIVGFLMVCPQTFHPYRQSCLLGWNQLLFYYVEFLYLSQPIPRAFLSHFALFFSAVTEHVQVEYRRETMAVGKVAFFYSHLPQCHPHMLLLLKFAAVSSKCI